MSETKAIYWVEDLGLPPNSEDYYFTTSQVSPNFTTERLAQEWLDREQRKAYGERLSQRAGLTASMEKTRDEILAHPQDMSKNALRGRVNLPFYQRTITQMRLDDERLARISFEDWLTGTNEILVGGCHFRYTILSSPLLNELPQGE
jgi:hypothetical protein